jgi:dsDNA-binding SOS-regulon protein
MKEKEVLFDEVIFDEKVYTDTKLKYEDMAEKLPDLLASLAAEGLPTTWDYFQMITDADNSFKDWINSQYMKRVSSFDFLPMDERNRIIDTYDALFERLKDDVAQLRRMRRERLPLFDADGTIMVDMDKIEQMARKAATTKLNATKIQAYWDAVNKVVDAMTELREFEDRNGLPSFVDDELVFLKQGRPQRYNLSLFLKEGGGTDLFQQIAAPYFTKK